MVGIANTAYMIHINSHDFSKVFDMVSYNTLVPKLLGYGLDR